MTFSDKIEEIRKKVCYEQIVFLADNNDKTDDRFDHIEYLIFDAAKVCAHDLSTLDKRILIICDREFIAVANRLLWECRNVVAILYLGTDDPYEPERKVKKKDSLLWDIQAEFSKDDNKAFISGWKNSYDGELFTDEEICEYVSNTRSKLCPYLSNEKNALEIGIGSGMISDALHGLCGRYDGCDISSGALEKLTKMNEDNGIDNIELFLCPADEIRSLGRKYDVILSSSITEYFCGYNYLRSVVKACIDSLNDRGVIYFGDVFDLDRKEAYERSVSEYEKTHDEGNQSKSFEHELFVPADYWSDLALSFKRFGITDIEITDKIGRIDNEINRYRYDVLIKVDKTKSGENPNERFHKYQFALGQI